MAHQLGISSRLFTNQERLERVCGVLDSGEGTSKDKLLAVAQDIRDIDKYRFVLETGLRIETLIGAAQRAVTQFLNTNPTCDPHLLNLLKGFAEVEKGADYYDALSLLQQIEEHHDLPSISDAPQEPDENVVFVLLDCVWHYTFMHYYWLVETRTRLEQETNAP